MQSFRDKEENRENLCFSIEKNMLSSSLAFYWINDKEDIVVFSNWACHALNRRSLEIRSRDLNEK